MKYKNLIVTKNGGIQKVVVNRPEVRNALNRETLNEIIDMARTLDDDVRALIFTGLDKSFVSGADVKELNTMSLLEYRQFNIDTFMTMDSVLRDLPIPTIAAVNGYCFGGGIALALPCDFIIASEKAKFGQPEINVGIFAGSAYLTALVGRIRAAEIVFTGRAITAQEAYDWNLITKVVPHDELEGEARKLAESLIKMPPIALAFAKKSINITMGTAWGSAAEYEAEMRVICFSTEDQKEGMQAFQEKRPPVFKGY